MRRPLAVFGCVILVCLLAASGYGARALLPVAALAAAAFFVAVLLRRKGVVKPGRWPYLALVPLVVCLALLYRAAYDVTVVAPVRSWAGETAETQFVVQAVVYDGGEVEFADVKVLAVEGARVAPFKLSLYYPGDVDVGDVVTATVRFSDFNPDVAGRWAAKGIYVRAVASDLRVTGRSAGLLERARLLQYSLSESIREKLPSRLGGVVAAITVGDRRYVPRESVVAYRASGVSHLQVVSGLHLTILCGVAAEVAGRFIRRKRARAIVCMLFVLGMMLLTGFTPSIVRSGVMFLMIFSAGLLWRRADVYTSMGLTAVLLCLQNPYAAADMGLLLSFSATLGVLFGNHLVHARRHIWRQRDGAEEPAWPVRVTRWLFSAALPLICITLATLPVLVLYNAGFSTMFLVMNLLAVPLMPAIIVAGYVMAIPASWPVLGLLARLGAIVAGALVALLEKLTEWCAAIPGVYQNVGGLFGLLAIVVVYLLFYLSWRHRRRSYAIFCAVVLLPSAFGLQAVLGQDLVYFEVAGSTSYPSVVIVEDNTAVVLYRGSLSAVERALQRYGVEECALLVDMRASAQKTEYEALNPDEVLRMNDITGQSVVQPMAQTTVWAKKQGGGAVVCVDVAGYKVAYTTGSMDLTAYAAVDILVAGSGTVQGEFGTLLATNGVPEWAGETDTVYMAGSGTQIVLRPGKSVKFREAELGTTNG